MTEVVKNDKKTIRAWAMFDWANSAYSLVISTAIFPIYFTSTSPEVVSIFGYEVYASSVFTFAVSFSYIILALLSPLLSGIADYTGNRKRFLRIFTIMGSLACISMYFFSGASDVWLGTWAFIFATLGYAGGLVFYDSYLPIIATKDQYDRLSARGFAYGYVGSVILMIGILTMVLKPEWYGITDSRLPYRIGFMMVGLWWLIFAQYTLTNLPKDANTPFQLSNIYNGYKEVLDVLKQALKMKYLKRFLISLFLYFAGVQTVIYVATIFAQEELHMETNELIIIVMLIQIVGILGAYTFAKLSEKMGNKFSLMTQIIIWTVITVIAYFTTNKTMFYGLAAAVGMVVGGIQALSRASYSKLLRKDEEDVTSFFSLYDVVFKVSIVAGTFIFGIVNQLTGDMRLSVISLGVLFLLGLIAMIGVKFEREATT